MPALTPASLTGGRRHRGASVKTLKKLLKKAGLKTTGRKATLTRRAKKAHLKMRGGTSTLAYEGSACVAPNGEPGRIEKCTPLPKRS